MRGKSRGRIPRKFLWMRSARFKLNSQSRVSLIRVCGLGGVPIALNDRTPFLCLWGELPIAPAPSFLHTTSM